jgi:hypothetical protein
MIGQTNPSAYKQPTGSPSIRGIHAYSGPSVQNTPVVMTQTGHPVQMFTVSPPSNNYEKYLSKQSHGLGITQVIVGVLYGLLNIIVTIIIPATITSMGMWGPATILFIISGAFGISASKLRTKCKIVTFMVLSIISAVVAILLLAGAIAGFVIAANSTIAEHSDVFTFVISVNFVTTILTLTEAVSCLWGSVLGCKVACCCKSNDYQQLVMLDSATEAVEPMYTVPASNVRHDQEMLVA